MSSIYRNKVVINQRGGSIDIDNTTDKEKVKISQRSGSNISMTNVANIELATNNKQTTVLNDSFETVSKNKNTFVVKDKVERVGGNTYALRGFVSKDELDSFKEWKEAYKPIAELNSQFKIKRTELEGTRAANPVVGSKVASIQSEFKGYSGTPIRDSSTDDVKNYAKVNGADEAIPAEIRSVTTDDVEQGAGAAGSNALEFGPEVSPSTEGGEWAANEDALNIDQKILDLQPNLTPIEQKMGDGGDETEFTKRHKFEQIGATFNDYESVRVDPKGRSQPSEMLVGSNGAFKNHDAVPHIEEVDNSSNFPCGNDDKVVGNRYSRNVGSGGIELKTTGTVEVGGSVLKVGFKRIHANSSHGIHVASEDYIDLQSLKTISLRTPRQVYVESSLGVRGDVVVGGSAYVEGELYCQHLTAPLEVHQTEDTTLYSKFNTNSNRTLKIGEAWTGKRWLPVYALSNPDLMVAPPHSHHHNGPAMRLTKTNADVRNFAARENINTHNKRSVALGRDHRKKVGVSPQS